MSAPRMTFSKVPPASKPKTKADDSFLIGDWWCINQDGEIWRLHDITTAHDLPGEMFLRPGSMSRQAAARLLALLATEMLVGGSTH